MKTIEPFVTVEKVIKVDDDLWETILKIDEAAFGPSSLTEWSLPLFLNYGRIYLARYQKEPAGVAELMRDWRDAELVYLYGYAVAPQFQGEGIGTVLLRSILEALPLAGFRRLQLTVHPENKVAIHIYRDKFGMRTIEFIRNYYGQGEIAGYLNGIGMDKMMSNIFKSGFAVLIGRPNVGKSSLLNAFIGQKIVITSEKPQTTRNQVRGITTGPNYQIIWIDTPGLHQPLHRLGKRMIRTAHEAFSGADLLLWVLDASQGLTGSDLEVAETIKNIGELTVFIVWNKTDLKPPKGWPKFQGLIRYTWFRP